MEKVKYFIYYFDDGFAYFNYTLGDLKKTDIMYRYKTTSELYDIFINQKKFREIQLVVEKELYPKDIILEGKKILKKLNIPRHKLITPTRNNNYLFM